MEKNLLPISLASFYEANHSVFTLNVLMNIPTSEMYLLCSAIFVTKILVTLDDCYVVLLKESLLKHILHYCSWVSTLLIAAGNSFCSFHENVINYNFTDGNKLLFLLIIFAIISLETSVKNIVLILNKKEEILLQDDWLDEFGRKIRLPMRILVKFLIFACFYGIFLYFFTSIH